jgi:hypothetical protein
MSLLPLGLLSQGGGAGGGANDFEFISATILSANQNQVTFSSIPAGYRHLEFRIVARGVAAGVEDGITIALNGDVVNSNYSWARTYNQVTGGSTQYDQTYGASFARTGWVTSNTATAGIFGVSKILLTDITATSKHLTGSAMTGYVRETGSGNMAWSGFTRKVNAALTQVTFGLLTSGDYAAGSRFSLYGYKG